MLPWLFLDIYWLHQTQKNFSTSVTVPQILVENKGHPSWRKTGFTRNSGYACRRWKNLTGLSTFSCAVKTVTPVLTSLDGICKPEVEIQQYRSSNKLGDVKISQRDLSGCDTVSGLAQSTSCSVATYVMRNTLAIGGLMQHTFKIAKHELKATHCW